jgi:hypothetical protein
MFAVCLVVSCYLFVSSAADRIPPCFFIFFEANYVVFNVGCLFFFRGGANFPIIIYLWESIAGIYNLIDSPWFCWVSERF